jgi:hypothetical protein
MDRRVRSQLPANLGMQTRIGNIIEGRMIERIEAACQGTFNVVWCKQACPQHLTYPAHPLSSRLWIWRPYFDQGDARRQVPIYDCCNVV